MRPQSSLVSQILKIHLFSSTLNCLLGLFVRICNVLDLLYTQITHTKFAEERRRNVSTLPVTSHCVKANEKFRELLASILIALLLHYRFEATLEGAKRRERERLQLQNALTAFVLLFVCRSIPIIFHFLLVRRCIPEEASMAEEEESSMAEGASHDSLSHRQRCSHRPSGASILLKL